MHQNTSVSKIKREIATKTKMRADSVIKWQTRDTSGMQLVIAVISRKINPVIFDTGNSRVKAHREWAKIINLRY